MEAQVFNPTFEVCTTNITHNVALQYISDPPLYDDFYWEVVPRKGILVHLHGVKLISAGINRYKYEGVIFDNITKLDFNNEVIVLNKYLPCITLPIYDVFNFNQVSDTLVEFELNSNIPPEIYDFDLRFYEKLK